MPTKTTDEKIDDVLSVLRDVIAHTDTQFTKMDDQFVKVNEKLDRIEYFVNGHDRRIDVIEDRVRQIATKIGIAFN